MDQTPHTPTPPPSSAPNSTPTTPSSNKGLIIGVIVGVVVLLLVVVGIVLAVALGGKNTTSNTGNNTESGATSSTEPSQPANNEEAIRAANAESAKYTSDFDVVCENGSISNAAEFTKPYTVAAFAKSGTSKNFSTVTLPYDAKYAAKYSEHEKVNVVACLEEKEGSAVKSKSCDFKSSGKKVSLDYYAVKYTMTVREAKTGKLIKELGEVNGPATTCPFFVSYDKSDPKYHAKPDADAADALLKKFVAE